MKFVRSSSATAHRSRLGAALRTFCCVLLGLLAAAHAVAAAPPLTSHVPPSALALTAVGRMNAADKLDLSLSLPLRNTETLSNLLEALYDPASPSYRQFLESEQFTASFGPAEEDYEALVTYARQIGFEITETHPNRMLLGVRASVGDIERAFHTTLRVYRHPEEDRTFYAPVEEPTPDSPVRLLHIAGLDDFSKPRPASQNRLSRPATPAYGSGPSGSYIGRDFRAAYAPGVTLTGLGQSIALLQFDGYYPNDIVQYASQAGLAVPTLQNVLVDRFNGSPGSANGEVALDIEMVMSMAPGVSKILVYEAGPNGYGDDMLNRMATDNAAKQISASWTFPTTAATTQILQQFAAQGQTYFNASGDSDAYTGAISPPVDNPYVTAVGGTTLSTGSGGSWKSEMVWNWGAGQGSGGGISTSFSLPTWQQGVNMPAVQGSNSRRNVPDVAMVADNVFVISDNGQSSYVGGTSCASPLWAGFMALVNQQATANGKPVVGFLNPTIYSIGKSSSYTGALHDVTSGNNTSPTSTGRFYAAAGYDLCTGWGTPNGQALINLLAPPATPALTPAPVRLLNPNYTAGAFSFSFQSAAGQVYALECKDGLSGSWKTLQNLTGTGGLETVRDPASSAQQRFYRIHSL